MKGIIFAELIGFMEEVGGLEFAETVLARSDLPNDGAFTRIGTYPAAYALKMVGTASELSGTPVESLCDAYGEWLFGRFVVLYPDIVGRYPSAESMLEHVGSHIHEEVVVLYPDAKPPQVSTSYAEDGALQVHYSSHRPLAHIAHGLIRGCLKHYGDPRRPEWITDADPSSASFRIVGEEKAAA